MNLTPQLREQVRLMLLRDLEDCRFGAPTSYLRASLAASGFTLSNEQVEAELDYLADPVKAFVAEVDKDISPEVRHWKITAKGRDQRAQHGQ